MTLARIPATLVAGATGAGKTTLLLRLLAQRQPGARWALLQNDFGAQSYAQAITAGGGALAVREVAGCMCCTAQVTLRTALVSLLRLHRPQRLLIEASALAEPHAVQSVLRAPGLAAALEPPVTVCVVAPHQLADTRYFENALYRTQIAAADIVVLEEDDERARAALAGLVAPQTPIVSAAHALARDLRP